MQNHLKTLTLITISLLISTNVFSQINMADSTVQVIGYWDKNEKYSYTVTNESFKVENQDTTEREFSKYQVDVRIIDSTENSYTIGWFYRDYEIHTENELVKRLTSLVEDMEVIIKTDALGAFIEVVNWKDFQKILSKATNLLRKEFKEVPQIESIIKQVESMYGTKESIEAAGIKEIQQFYTFHGGKYKYGEEVNGILQVPNLYGGKPFDSNVDLWLDEINPENNNFIIRMKQSVNADQLTKTTFDYLTNMASTMNVAPPKWEEFPPLKNETWTASRIHGTGWVIYSIETKEVSADGALKVEERIIEIQ